MLSGSIFLAVIEESRRFLHSAADFVCCLVPRELNLILLSVARLGWNPSVAMGRTVLSDDEGTRDFSTFDVVCARLLMEQIGALLEP